MALSLDNQTTQSILKIDMLQAAVVADLHGNLRLYELLLRITNLWKLSSVFIAGDLAPSAVYNSNFEVTDHGISRQQAFFVDAFIPLLKSFLLAHHHTDIYVIMGNDDRRANEPLLQAFDAEIPNFHFVNNRLIEVRESRQKQAFFPGEVPLLWVAGYPYVPPGGSLLMDWVKDENHVGLRPAEIDPCTDIYTLGILTAPRDQSPTIAEDLSNFGAYIDRQTGNGNMIQYDPTKTIHLFHAPPYNTLLDWSSPYGRQDFLRLPDHVGSVEIRRFIEQNQPYLVLCGHCHESVVLGHYKTDIGRSRCVNPGSQTHIDVLSLVQFDLYEPRSMKQLFIHAR